MLNAVKINILGDDHMCANKRHLQYTIRYIFEHLPFRFVLCVQLCRSHKNGMLFNGKRLLFSQIFFIYGNDFKIYLNITIQNFMLKSRPCNQSAVCYAVVNVMSSCCLLLDARPTSPSLLDNTGHPAHEHQSQVTKILLNETATML